MKMKKILIIFLIALIFTFIIYKINYKEKLNVLILGDNNIKSLSKDNYINHLINNNNIDNVNDLFTFDNKTNKNIINDIKSNYAIYYKNNKIKLNELISNSEIIILTSNNNEYISKCNKPGSVLKEYNKKVYEKNIELINIINKISNTKIIILGNYCSNYNKEVSKYLDMLYNNYNYINMYKLYNEYKNKDMEYELYKQIIDIVELK